MGTNVTVTHNDTIARFKLQTAAQVCSTVAKSRWAARFLDVPIYSAVSLQCPMNGLQMDCGRGSLPTCAPASLSIGILVEISGADHERPHKHKRRS